VKIHAKPAITTLATAAITAAVLQATSVAASDPYVNGPQTTAQMAYASSVMTINGNRTTTQEDQEFLKEFKATLVAWGGGRWPFTDTDSLNLAHKVATDLKNGTPEYETVVHQTWIAIDRKGSTPPAISGPASAALVQTVLNVYILPPQDQAFLTALQAHGSWPVDPKYSIALGHSVYQELVEGAPFTVQETIALPPPRGGPYAGHAIVKLTKQETTDLLNAVISGYHLPAYAVRFISPPLPKP
jgi:hypothetical protein